MRIIRRGDLRCRNLDFFCAVGSLMGPGSLGVSPHWGVALCLGPFLWWSQLSPSPFPGTLPEGHCHRAVRVFQRPLWRQRESGIGNFWM